MLEKYSLFESLGVGKKKAVLKSSADIERERLKELEKAKKDDAPKSFLHRIDMIASRLYLFRSV